MPFSPARNRSWNRPAYVAGGGSYVPAITDNFNSYTVGTSASAMGSTFNGYTYGIASNTQFYGANGNSVQCDIASGAHDWGLSSKLPFRLGQNDEIWMRFRTFFPTGFNFTASPHLKFFRIDQGPSSSGHGSHIDWYLRFVGQAGDTNNVGYFDFIQEDYQNWLYDTTTLPTGIIRNTWQTWNFYYKLNSVAANSKIRLWRDSTLLVDVNTRETLGSSTNVIGSTADINAQGMMFSTYWNGGSPATQTAYIDDWEIATNASAPTATDAGGKIWIGL